MNVYPLLDVLQFIQIDSFQILLLNFGHLDVLFLAYFGIEVFIGENGRDEVFDFITKAIASKCVEELFIRNSFFKTKPKEKYYSYKPLNLH